MLSFGTGSGTPDNLRNFLLMLADKYVFPAAEDEDRPEMQVAEPEVFPDLGIWHPLAPTMFEDLRNTSTGPRVVPISQEARQGTGDRLVLQRISSR